MVALVALLFAGVRPPLDGPAPSSSAPEEPDSAATVTSSSDTPPGQTSHPIEPLLAPANVQTLRPGETVVAKPTAERSVVYEFHLNQGNVAHIRAMQRGIDVVLELSGPGLDEPIKADRPTYAEGPEEIFHEARQSGLHTLIVDPFEGATSDGVADISLKLYTASNQAQRDWMTGEQLRFDGEALSATGDPDSLWAAMAKFLDSAESFDRAEATYLASESRHRAAQTGRKIFDGIYTGRLLSTHPGVDIARRLPDDVTAAKWIQETSLEAAKRSLDGFKLLGWEERAASTLHLLGCLHFDFEDYESSLLPLDQALDYYRTDQVRNRSYLAAVLAQRAQAYSNLGRLGEARRDFDLALQSYPRDGHPTIDQNLATTLKNRASLLQILRKTDLARADLEEALEIFQHHGMHRRANSVLHDLANIAGGEGRTLESIAVLEDAFEAAREASQRDLQALYLNKIGKVWLHLGNPSRALNSHRQALATFEMIENTPGQGAASHGIARALESRGQLSEAREWFLRSLSLYERSEDLFWAPANHGRIADISLRLNQVELALHHARRAISLDEYTRGLAHGNRQRQALLAKREVHHEILVSALMRLHTLEPGEGHDISALFASDRSRARTLIESLHRISARKSTDSAANLDSEIMLRQQILEKEQERLAAQESEDFATLERVLNELHHLLDTLDLVKHARERTISGTKPNDAWSLDSLPVSEDEVILVYHLGREQSHLWTATARGIETFNLAPRAQLRALVQAARSALHAPSKRSAMRHADSIQRLSAALIAPAASVIEEYKSIVVIPDGVLHHVPFAALTLGSRSTELLITGHTVWRAPSLAAMQILQRSPPEPSIEDWNAAVFADPVYAADDPRITPKPGALSTSRSFVRLPGSAEEATTICRMFSDNACNAFIGTDASRKSFHSQVYETIDLIHFAGHSELDPDPPAVPRLVLSTFSEDSEPLYEKSYLPAHEIAAMHIPASLVFLSSCSSVLGDEVRGEGPVGLTHAFLEAGARQVIATLWPIDSTAATTLTQSFYRNLRANASVAGALRAAQNELRNTRMYSNPYYWAGFILVGG